MIKNKHFLPAYIFALLIFISSSLPTDQVQKVRTSSRFLDIILSDFSLHSIAFGLFAGLLGWGFYRARNPSIPYILIGLSSITYGLFIEVYQYFLPYRSFNFNDLFADAVGVVAFLVLFAIFIRAAKRRQSAVSSSE